MSDNHSFARISQTYQRNELGSDFPQLMQRKTDYFQTALCLYSSIDDLVAAPTKCLCTKCSRLWGRNQPSQIFVNRKIRHNAHQQIRQRTHTSEEYDVLDSSSGAKGSALSEKENVVINSVIENSHRGKEAMSASGEVGENTQVDLQNTGYGGFVDGDCDHCGLSLMVQFLTDIEDPWREHARWRPNCPLVKKEKGEKFIHDVIEETRKLKQHFIENMTSSTEMDIKVVIEANKKYESGDISKAIEELFSAYGGNWPTSNQLLFRLESMKLFKNVHNSSEYCMQSF